MPMKDGYRTLLTFAGINNAEYAEVTVKPPGINGRGPIDITSMRNNKVTTKWPKALIDFSNCQSTVQWNPAFFPQIRDFVVNKNQRISVQLPTGNAMVFYGWVDSWEPNDHREGEVPLATLGIVVSNNNGDVETMPILL